MKIFEFFWSCNKTRLSITRSSSRVGVRDRKRSKKRKKSSDYKIQKLIYSEQKKTREGHRFWATERTDYKRVKYRKTRRVGYNARCEYHKSTKRGRYKIQGKYYKSTEWVRYSVQRVCCREDTRVRCKARVQRRPR